MISRRSYSLAFTLSALFLFLGCSPRTADVLVSEGFEPSETTAEDIINFMPASSHAIHSVDGRAQAQASGPDYSEQATLFFTSDRTQSLLRMRNNLGIEGGRILADPDSVLIYDRINQKAWKMSASDSRNMLLNGFTAFNILEFLLPELNADDVEAVFHDDSLWLLKLYDGKQIFVSKTDGHLARIEMSSPTSKPDAFDTFIFSSHGSIAGVLLPRRIQILSNDRKSNIFLTIRGLEVNPSELSFDINIPESVYIERR